MVFIPIEVLVRLEMLHGEAYLTSNEDITSPPRSFDLVDEAHIEQPEPAHASTSASALSASDDGRREKMSDGGLARMLTIPTEIILEIWCSLNTFSLDTFSRVCKAFRAFSRTPYFIAEYFLRNHHPHSIFHAICFPHIFTVEVFEHLIKRGAPLPRSLVQELGRSHFGDGTFDDRYGRVHYHGSWGSRLSFGACLAVMRQGEALYGGKVQFERSKSDEDQVARCMSGAMYTAWTSDTPQGLRDVFEQGNYLPLPDHIGVGRSKHFFSRILARYPDIVPLALENSGWQPSAAERRSACRQILLCEKLYVDDFRDKMLEKVEQLSRQPGFAITPILASEVLNSVLEAALNQTAVALEVQGFQQQTQIPDGYHVLLQLDQKGSLAFSLGAVVAAVMGKAWKAEWPGESFKVLQKIATDFPALGETMSTPVLLSLCRYLQTPGRTSAVDMAKELQRVKVDDSALANVLLSTKISNAALVFDAIQAKLPEFDQGAFVHKILPKVLCQPFRGGILEVLKDKVPDFVAVLEEALMAQDFYFQDLSTASHYPQLRCQLFKHGPLTSVPPAAASQASVTRSIVSFEAPSSRIESPGWKGRRRLDYYESFFTDFWKLNGRTAPGCDGKGNHAGERLIKGPDLFGLAPALPNTDMQLAGTAVEPVAALRYEDLSKESFYSTRGADGYGFPFEKRHVAIPFNFDNIQAVECAKILPRASPASSLLLSHALINDSSDSLLTKLLTAMKPLSFDLGHWKLLGWLGREPPLLMSEAIAFGAPFSADGSYRETPLYDMQVLNAKRKVTAAEKKAALQQAEVEATVTGRVESKSSMPPRFNAQRNRRNQEADLAKASSGAMSWSAPFTCMEGGAHFAAGFRQTEDQEEVHIGVGFGKYSVFLTEAEARRRLKSITEWIDHLQGLLNIERRLYTLEKHVSEVKQHGHSIQKTSFVKALERKSAGSSLPMIRAAQRALRQAVERFEKRELAKRADRGDRRAELKMELDALRDEIAKHGEQMPDPGTDDPPSSPSKRRCITEAKCRRVSKRVRMAEDDKYDDSADETFDIGKWTSKEKDWKGAKASRAVGRDEEDEGSDESTDSDASDGDDDA